MEMSFCGMTCLSFADIYLGFMAKLFFDVIQNVVSSRIRLKTIYHSDNVSFSFMIFVSFYTFCAR